jgi:hypothetical protein
LFEQDYPLSSMTLPASGSMRNGVCSLRPPLEPLTAETAGGVWGTPTARDDQKTPQAHMAMKARMGRSTATSLTVQVKMWSRSADSSRQSPDLRDEVSRWATASHHHRTTVPDGNDGSPRVDLNPEFVASLMGLPSGWLTPSVSAATASSPKPPAQHGTNS